MFHCALIWCTLLLIRQMNSDEELAKNLQQSDAEVENHSRSSVSRSHLARNSLFAEVLSDDVFDVISDIFDLIDVMSRWVTKLMITHHTLIDDPTFAKGDELPQKSLYPKRELVIFVIFF